MPSNTCTSGLYKSKTQNRKETLVNAYGNWLNSFTWDYYCTFTTRYPLGMQGARNLMRSMHSQLSSKHNITPVIFWVAEPFDTKYGCHLHALVNVCNKNFVTKIDLKNVWQVVSKGRRLKEYNNTTIKDYDNTKGGHFYFSKYLDKSNVDYDVF